MRFFNNAAIPDISQIFEEIRVAGDFNVFLNINDKNINQKFKAIIVKGQMNINNTNKLTSH